MGTTGNDAILAQLVADGIQYIFGNPGTVEQGLLEALGDEPRLRYILGLHETVAVAMADGYARATRRPAVVQLHSSVGVGNGIGMLYQAKRGHSPLVVLAGDAGVRYDATEAQMAADLVAMARPATKASLRVTDSRSVLRMLRRAVKIASTPPQGPVFLDLPADVLDELNEEPVHPSPLPVTEVVPPEAHLARAASLLVGAAKPLVLIGDGIDAALAQQPLRQVAELLGADVWGVNHSAVNFDPRHPLYRGQLGHMFGDVSAARVRDADAVLIVGTYVFPEVYPRLADPFGKSARIVHIDLDVENIAKNHRVDLGLVAHPGLTLAALAGQLEQVSSPAERATAGERLRRRAAARDAEPVPVPSTVAEHFIAALAQRTGDNLVVFDEA
ncbi:MAG TPA: thiamine pyrophosphate-binding protein, partial [Jatrophihabitans sp.]|nr:thiamine pyrophosphate-binding protein [Jatrophihabitans sp.]